MQENVQKIKELFNIGKFKKIDLEFYVEKGYKFNVRNGLIDEVIPPYMEIVQECNRRVEKRWLESLLHQ